MEDKTSYISTGINQSRKSLDWNPEINIIAYASCNRIILYDPQRLCVVGVSAANSDSSVICVQWARSGRRKAAILLTLSSNGSARLWHYEAKCNDRINLLLRPLTELKGNHGALCFGSATYYKQKKPSDCESSLIVAASDDRCIYGWRVNADSGVSEEIFCYTLPKRSLPLDIVFIPVAYATKDLCFPLILYGGDDGRIHVVTVAANNECQSVCALIGHLDWVMSLDYTIDDNDDILLSSGSKDGVIRLWRLSLKSPGIKTSDDELLQMKSIEIHIPVLEQESEIDTTDSIRRSETCLTVYCSLESVMHGHEGLVSVLDWGTQAAECPSKQHQLLSCSKTEDRAVILWQPNDENSDEGIWVEVARLGEVGGNREGFINARFGPDRRMIAATSYQGGLHIWHLEEGSWEPTAAISGHFGEVVDIDWDPEGRYLISVSKDQTSRLHAPFCRGDGSKWWQEIARPQVHGYDMSCVVHLDKYQFASGAEEKVIRGFMATKGFIRNLANILHTDIDVSLDEYKLPESASVPSLGLSNKADDLSYDPSEKIVRSLGPPSEDKLMLGTLWPEIFKLYGHGNEILSLAITRDRTLLASSCRGTNEIDAKIIIWIAGEWKEGQGLIHHRLSVTQMDFSYCSQYLLSVSRDRSWTVLKRNNDNLFSVTFSSGKLEKTFQHSRIIWSCCWIPNSLRFVTGSRDKTVAVWRPVSGIDPSDVGSWVRESVSVEGDEVTAVSAVSLPLQKLALIAIGYNNGKLLLRTYSTCEGRFTTCHEVGISHVSTIRRLKFNPVLNHSYLQLASCGSDNAVIVYDIKCNTYG